MVGGVNLHDVIKLDTLTPSWRSTLDLTLIPPTVFNVCFCRLIARGGTGGPQGAGDPRSRGCGGVEEPIRKASLVLVIGDEK